MESADLANVTEGVDHKFMARFGAGWLGEKDGALRLLVRKASDAQRRKIERALGGRKVTLEELSAHSELEDVFEDTVARCKAIAGREPSPSRAEIEDHLIATTDDDNRTRAPFLN